MVLWIIYFAVIKHDLGLLCMIRFVKEVDTCVMALLLHHSKCELGGGGTTRYIQM